MPYNGSGSYSAPASTWNPAVSATTVNSTDWNSLLSDLSTALSTCLLKDGTQTPTANIPMGGFKFTGLAAGTGAGNSVRYEQVFNASGASGFIFLNPSNIVQALTDGATISWDANSGAIATVTLGGSRTMAAPTNLKAGGFYRLIVTQDVTGGRTLTWNAVFKAQGGGTMPQPETTAAAVTIFDFTSDGTNLYTAQCSPFIDSNYIVRGSSDPTKKVRLEADGLTTATTRVLTIQDKDITVLGQEDVATQADQETATSTTTFVSPGRQHYHPSAAKVWAYWGVTSTILASYNVSSITDTGTGDWTVNFTTSFSSVNFAPHYTPIGDFTFGAGTTLQNCHAVTAVTASSARCKNAGFVGSTNTVSAQDPTTNSFVAFGDQ